MVLLLYANVQKAFSFRGLTPPDPAGSSTQTPCNRTCSSLVMLHPLVNPGSATVLWHCLNDDYGPQFSAENFPNSAGQFAKFHGSQQQIFTCSNYFSTTPEPDQICSICRQ